MTLSIVNDDASYCHQLLQNFTEIYPVEKWKIRGFFSDSDLLNINCHWMEFEPFEPFVHFTLAVIFTIVLLAGFFSNAFVIYIIVWYAILIIIYVCIIMQLNFTTTYIFKLNESSRKFLTPANILLVNLTISHLLPVLTVICSYIKHQQQ